MDRESLLMQKERERRVTAHASDDWTIARGEDAIPFLANLGIGDTMTEWHDRFLIRSDNHMHHAVFIACGDTLQSHWNMERLGSTLADALPSELQGPFAEGCQKTIKDGSPVPVEGSYHDEILGEVLFSCIMMPVQSSNDSGSFIYGAYSHKVGV